MQALSTARLGVRYSVVVEDCCVSLEFTSVVKSLGWIDDVHDTVVFTNGVVINRALVAAIEIEEVR